MQIHVIAYRDENRPDLLELAAFKDKKKAVQVVKELTSKYEELFKKQLGEEETNKIWHNFLGEKQIPENKFFLLNFRTYGNFALRISELALLD